MLFSLLKHHFDLNITDTALKSRSLYCFTTSVSPGVENYFPRLWGMGISDAILSFTDTPSCQSFLCFNGGYRFYQFTALPFSIATVSLQFTVVAKEVKLVALAESSRIHQYIDDWLIRADLKQQCQVNTHSLVSSC